MATTNPRLPIETDVPESDLSALELHITRLIDAPRDLVFQAWTDPEMACKWGGPVGFTAKPEPGPAAAAGVAWRTYLASDDGRIALWQSGIYREVVAPERLVFSFAWEDDDGRPEHETLVTITFAEHAGKTEMSFHQSAVASKQSRDNHTRGWSSAFECLDDFVAPDGSFVISRFFAAPAELVFDAWTKVEHLARWFGPPGCTLVDPQMDLRPGGHFHYGMRDPAGGMSYGMWTFGELLRPTLIECVVAFCDESHNVIRHPLASRWPLRTRSIVRLSGDMPDGTLLTLRKTPIDATGAERAAFVASHDGMNGGWKPAFESLDRYLTSVVSAASGLAEGAEGEPIVASARARSVHSAS